MKAGERLMPQSDGKTQLKRLALQVGEDQSKGWYRFAVNPTQYEHNIPQRTTVFKTKSQIIIEDFGKDLETIKFSGTTGFREDSQGRNGKQRLDALQSTLKNYMKQGGNGNKPGDELTFYNLTDDENYIVHVASDALKIERSAEQPLLFTYTVSLVVLRGAEEPDDREQANPSIGNDEPSVGGGEKIESKIVGKSTAQTTSYMAGIANAGTAVNPRATSGAYSYGVEELKGLISYE